MKRFLSAALLAGGMLFTAGVAPAFADPGYFRDGVQLVGGDRDGGGRDYDDGFRDGADAAMTTAAATKKPHIDTAGDVATGAGTASGSASAFAIAGA
jgi:hypothetical protein